MALYSPCDILPSLFSSNLSNTRLISSGFGWKVGNILEYCLLLKENKRNVFLFDKLYWKSRNLTLAMDCLGAFGQKVGQEKGQDSLYIELTNISQIFLSRK
uniref:Uncharacterized protein n=1 Tax=Opuntia streptacantha TaxID=393608 RepID=A0A7C8Z081_OPUST